MTNEEKAKELAKDYAPTIENIDAKIVIYDAIMEMATWKDSQCLGTLLRVFDLIVNKRDSGGALEYITLEFIIKDHYGDFDKNKINKVIMKSYRAVKLQPKELVCTKCKKVWPISHFSKYKKNNEIIYYHWCKDCFNLFRRNNRRNIKTSCGDCVHYSVLRKKCKIHMPLSSNCSEYDKVIFFDNYTI